MKKFKIKMSKGKFYKVNERFKEGSLPQDSLKKIAHEKMFLDIRTDSGVFFGDKKDNSYVGMRQGEEGNIIVIGGNGSGKSAGIIKPTMSIWKDAFCATDIKGELSDYYAKLYNIELQTVPPHLPPVEILRPYLIFDPTDISCLSYDPFWWLMEDDESNLINNIREIAFVIYPIVPNDYNLFWSETERDVFSAALLYYFKLGLSFSETLCKIAAETTTSLCADLKSSKDIQVKMLLGEVSELREDALACIDRGIRNKLIPFACDPYISHAFRGKREGAKCFNWNYLKSHNIFLRIPPNRIEQWGGAINLMYTQLIRYLERRPEMYSPEGKDNIQTLLLMDEFPRFGKLEMITSAMSTLRSKNVNICLVLQSIAQLDKIYGSEERRIILDNCQYQAILRANDAETQKYFADLIGTKVTIKQNKNQQFDERKMPVGYSFSKTPEREYVHFSHEFSVLDDVLLLSPYGFQKLKKFQKYDSDINGTSLAENCVTDNQTVIADKNIVMLSLEERLSNANKKIEEATHQRRINNQKEKEMKQKKETLRNMIIGELVVKYFPELLDIEDEINSENKENTEKLEAFLETLASHPEVVEQIKAESQKKAANSTNV